MYLTTSVSNYAELFYLTVLIFTILTKSLAENYDYSEENHDLQSEASNYFPERNIQPFIVRSNADNLTIFEIVTLSKLQTFADDAMGVQKFQDPFWASSSHLLNLLDSSKWNLKTAQIKFKKAMEKRTQYEQEKEIPDEKMLNSFYYEMKGFDKEGCPVIIAPVGEWRTYRSFVEKVKSIHKANTKLRKYFKYAMDGILQVVKSRILPCSQITLILDMEHFTFNHVSGINFFLQSLKEFDKTYPALLKIAFIINSSPEFLKAAKYYNSEIPWDLKRKTFLFTDEIYWKEVLLETIDATQLAPMYGGENFFFES